MAKKPNRKRVLTEINEGKKFFEEEGSSRAITSGSLSMMFALIRASCIWSFTILATGWEGLQYFGLTVAITGLVGIFGMGLSRVFLAEIKEAFIINDELGRLKAASYSKILILLGILLGLGMIALSYILNYFLDNDLLRACIFASGFSTILGYFNLVLSNGVEVKNRYDITSKLSIFGGIFLLLGGSFFIYYGWNPIWFAFHPFFNFLAFVLFMYFFYKIAPFSFKDIITARLTSKGMKQKATPEIQELIKANQITSYIKNSAYSMITNLELTGIFGNFLVLLAAFYLAIFNPSLQGLGVSLLTIIMTYGAVKTVILYYSAPLNIEIAEANVKKRHQIIEDSINDSTRISSILALGFLAAMVAISRELLLLLHGEIFHVDGIINSDLLLLSQILFILVLIGEFSYGYSTLFGNALIGSGDTKYAAIGFGITFIIIMVISPIFIFFYDILGVGITIIISGLFLLTYMLIQLKIKLNVVFNFKLRRLIPNLVILFIFFLIFPIMGTLELILSIIIGGVCYMALNPFFGVSIPRDFKMIGHLFETIKLKPLGNIIIKIMNKTYNISPINKEKFILE